MSNKRTWSQGFDDGFITACSHLVAGHGEDGLAEFLLIGGGYAKKIQSMKLHAYDRKNLKDVIKRLKERP